MPENAESEHIVTQLDVPVISPGTELGLDSYAYRCSCGAEFVGDLNGQAFCPYEPLKPGTTIHDLGPDGWTTTVTP